MKRKHSESAFTILEVLIAVIIIGVLTTILVPVLTNRAAEAKITAAKAELANIADAEERVAINTGFYVRLYALDDLVGGDGIGFGETTPNADRIDGVRDENKNTVMTDDGSKSGTPNADKMFIDPATGLPLIDSSQSLKYKMLTTNETSFGWQGPYYTIHRDETIDPKDDTKGREIGRLAGIPTDPWGNDYILFTTKGALNEPAGTILEELTWSKDKKLTKDEVVIFDRPTILSLGPNGVPGDGIVGSDLNKLGKGDDLFFSFGN